MHTPPAARHELFAVAAPGLESIVADELSEAGLARGARAIEGGVRFAGDDSVLYAANLRLRVASRVVVRFAAFHADAFHLLERRARQLPWEARIAPNRAVTIRVTCHKSRLYHSDAVAERIASAISRRVPGAHVVGGGAIAGDDADGDAQLIVVRLVHDRCTVSLDTSGALLHRRGYRQALTRATLRETLAAAMLRASGWDGSRPLIDPMCGSGTIPIEAALIARRIAPGLNRSFAFQRWPSFDPARWDLLRDAATSRVLPRAPAALVGSDRDAGAIERSRANAGRAGVEHDIAFAQRPLAALEVPEAPNGGALITNPPYGVRVGEHVSLRSLYAQLGQLARQRLGGWTITMLLADSALERQLNLDLHPLFETTNGGIAVRCELARIPVRARAGAWTVARTGDGGE